MTWATQFCVQHLESAHEGAATAKGSASNCYDVSVWIQGAVCRTPRRCVHITTPPPRCTVLISSTQTANIQRPNIERRGQFNCLVWRRSIYCLQVGAEGRRGKCVAMTARTRESVFNRQQLLRYLNKIPAFYGTRRFITVSTRARHWSLSWARWIQSTTSNLIFKVHMSIIFSSTLGPPSGSLLQVLRPKLHINFFPMRATCLHFIPFNLIILRNSYED
jgi:hypothetical protein